MEALGGSHGVSLSLVWCGYVFMEGMKFMVVINENPPLKTITKQKKKKGLKIVENHNLDSKFENNTNTIFENKNRKL